MSCGNKNCGGDCGCGSTGKKSFEVVNLNDTPPCNEQPDSSCSNKGKFYDKLTEDFIVPQVGEESWLNLCEANLWSVGQFIAVAMSGNKIASFKITAKRSRKIKVLNGCDKSGSSGIIGNPEPGTKLPEGSVFFPIAPTGCESDFASRLIQTLSQYGNDAVMELLAESPSICFASVPEIGESEEVHLFGGTMPDCDCAPEATISSCLRKLLRIFTGQSGRTLCMPDVLVTSTNDVTGSADPTMDGPKRIALFMPGKKCLAAGPTVAEFKECGDNEAIEGDEASFNAVSACKDGIAHNIIPTEVGQFLESVKEVVDGEDVFLWKVRGKRNYAVINQILGSGVGGGNSPAPSKTWYTRELNTISQETPDFVGLASNEITIKKPGIYEIKWSQCFKRCKGVSSRLINSDVPAEVYYGITGYADNVIADSKVNETHFNASGTAYVEVTTTKKLKLQYMIDTASSTANELGEPVNLPGVSNIFANLSIMEL